jgi:hypothetical protein
VALDKKIDSSKIVNVVLLSMIDVKNEPGIKELGIVVEDERAQSVFEKTHFEILCFAAYWTSTQILKYVSKNQMRNVNDKDISQAQYFYQCIRKSLAEFCHSKNFDQVDDLVFDSNGINEFGSLNSDKRLSQYEKLDSTGKMGDSFKWFAKHLAITFALNDYPIFEIQAQKYAEHTVKISQIAMMSAFKK